MIKLIVSDVDGTLVRDGENGLNPEFMDVVLKLKKKGIYFAVASGRQIHSIEKLFAPIGREIFYIANNGAYVGSYGRNLFLYPMDTELARTLVEEIHENPELKVMVEGPATAYLESAEQEFIHWMRDGYRFHVTEVEDARTVPEPIIKVSAFREADIQKATAYLVEKYGGRCKAAISGAKWLDFMDAEVNKGRAVRTLQESLGIAPEETMAFGDQQNDLEMLKQAYYSFAIGNARPEVKAAARFQADTNVNDGVLKVIRQLL